MPRAPSFDPASVLRRDVAKLRRVLERNGDDSRQQLARAQQRLAERVASVPDIKLDAPLPITDRLDEVARQLDHHQVVIVAGETGSGKTTQLPKLCLAAGYGRRGTIGHTQPRRLAARAVARRVAQELSVTLGEQVGYAVRFDDKASPGTLIKVMTDGLLLTEIRRDRFLEAYDVIIIDEAHERSLNIDFLLGYLKGLLPRRPDLKLIITSATIDVEAFAGHFGDAPVVEVSGRGYPVEVVYQDDESIADMDTRLVEALDSILNRRPGPAPDVLLFQSGEREIFETSKLLRERYGDRCDVLPLYARLSVAEQNRVFAPSGRRRVVVATNIAETSLTVPNIGYVVDPGEARVSRYSFRSKLQRLPVEAISQASAEQRKGRCGRVAPGVCYRLYSSADFESRPDYTDPEIRRTNLASVMLQMEAFGLGRIERFGFLDPPDPRAIRDALRLLEELGALESGKLTKTGRLMARLPVDPRLARMLIKASELGALTEVLVCVSGLAVPDPRERPLDAQQASDRLHAEFYDERSDFVALINLWSWYEETRQNSTRSDLRRACQKRYLSPVRMREWRELHRQLLITARDLRLSLNQDAAGYAEIHRAILSGSLSLTGQKQERGEYLGARQLKFRIFPGSGLERLPRWLMAAEISETRRVYARCVAEIEPRWIEQAAGHLLKRSHSEPHWSERRGEALVYEKVTLFGLTLAEKRRVSFKSVDPDQARDILLKQGLVPGAIRRSAPFLEHNLTLVREVRELEAKGRRADLLVDEASLAAFYDERIGEGICDVAGLEAWRHTAELAEPEILFMSRSGVLRGDPQLTEVDFPGRIAIGEVEFDVKYAFAPGALDDGVSVQVPVGLLAPLRPAPLDWLVPGLFEGLCEQLLRSLPKSLRRDLTPIADKVPLLVERLSADQRFRSGRLELALAEAISMLFGVVVPVAAWEWERVAPHLRMNIQVRDENGRLLLQDRDLQSLIDRLSTADESGSSERIEALTQEGLTRLPEDGLDPHVVLGSGTGRRIAYPALEDRGDSAAIVLMDNPRDAQWASNRGYTRLTLLGNPTVARGMSKELKSRSRMGLHFAALGDWEQLHAGVLHAATWYCFFEDQPRPLTRSELETRVAERHGSWFETFMSVVDQTEGVLEKRFGLARLLADSHSPAFDAAADDLRRHLGRLVPADFLDATPSGLLAEIPRYLDAMRYRWENLQGRVEKDAAGSAQMRALEARYDVLVNLLGDDQRGALQELGEALQELRVALFAQPIGTRYRISEKRVVKLIESLERHAGTG